MRTTTLKSWPLAVALLLAAALPAAATQIGAPVPRGSATNPVILWSATANNGLGGWTVVGTYTEFGNRSANTVLAGPISGAATAPAFRGLAAADLPASGVTAGSYGDAAHAPVIVVNAQGQVTGVSNVAITGGGGTTVLFGTFASRPAASTANRLYVTTDTNEWYRDTGAAWVYVNGSSKANCVATLSAPNGSIAPGTFNTITLPTVVSDPGGNFSTTSGFYTVPVTGNYQITTKLRIADNAPSGISYGQGAGTLNADGPHFQWFATVSSTGSVARNGSLNIRTARFNAGDQIRMYAYADSTSSLGVIAAEMDITLLSQG